MDDNQNSASTTGIGDTSQVSGINEDNIDLNNPSRSAQIVEQLKGLPIDVLEKLKDLDFSQYPKEVLDKLKELNLAQYPKELLENIKNLYHGESAPDPAITQYILKIQTEALNKKASDIFLSSGSQPSLRIDGRTIFLKDEPVIETKMLQKYLLSVMSEYHRKKLSENLEHDFSLTNQDGQRFRVNAFLQKNGISITFRTIPNTIPTFEELELPEQLQAISDFPSGLVLVTGSTGSGKSTTLASIIDNINKKYQKHILTIEDPIEFVHPNQNSLIEQREVGIHSKSFANSLRSALREAPDVILVGEMRDPETISLALTAAETGSLVLGTLHSNGAPNAINRIIDTFPAGQQEQIRMQLGESLRAVIWQTLIPRQEGIGRSPAFELLVKTTGVSNLIRENKIFQIKNEIETGQNNGMISLKIWLEKLISEGRITQDTAQEVLNHHG